MNMNGVDHADQMGNAYPTCGNPGRSGTTVPLLVCMGHKRMQRKDSLNQLLNKQGKAKESTLLSFGTI